MRRRDSLKQREVSAFDREIAEGVRGRLGLERTELLHPLLVFNSYYRIVKSDQRAYARSVRADGTAADGLAARYERSPTPEDERLAGVLPDDYVAVRFYFRPSFPDTEENRAIAAGLIDSLAELCPVVLLNNRMELDDHYDFDAATAQRVITIDHLMSPEDNLRVQTAAIGGARAFVGTYGGLAYLGPFLGVPSFALSSDASHTQPWHLDLAHRVLHGAGWPSLVSLSSGDLDLVRLVLGSPTASSQREEAVGR
jgi:hypothetical protein